MGGDAGKRKRKKKRKGLTEELGRPADLFDGFEADEGGYAATGMVY